jgi:hypothetical protein
VNISRKIISLLILGIILIIASGCQITKPGSDSNPEEPPAIHQPEGEKLSQPENDDQKGDEGDEMEGWSKLEERVALSELTEYGSQPLDNNIKIGFSISVPENWTRNSGVFYDEQDKKVAEIPPVVLLKAGEESEFLDYQPAREQDEELISRENIKNNSYSGVKVLSRIPTELGIWYPHIYRLSDGEHGFTMIFYSQEPNEEDQELFDRIINSFSFQ